MKVTLILTMLWFAMNIAPANAFGPFVELFEDEESDSFKFEVRTKEDTAIGT